MVNHFTLSRLTTPTLDEYISVCRIEVTPSINEKVLLNWELPSWTARGLSIFDTPDQLKVPEYALFSVVLGGSGFLSSPFRSSISGDPIALNQQELGTWFSNLFTLSFG